MLAYLDQAIEERVIFVDPHDIDGLADAMRQVSADAEPAADLRGRAVVCAALFTWGRAAWGTVAVYEEVVACKR